MSDGCIVIVPGGPPRDVCESAASTSTTLAFVQPAVGADVTVNVGTTDWMAPGQAVFVEGGGYYTAVPATATTVRLTNLGYTGNAAPGALINPPQLVSPGGLQGPAVTYEITFKPGGLAVPGQVYTTNAALNVAIAALIATGAAVTVFLDGSSNGNAVNFSASADYKNLVSFRALDFANGATNQVVCTTSAGVTLRGVFAYIGGNWTFNTTTSAGNLPSVGVLFQVLRISDFCSINASSAANPAIGSTGSSANYIFLDAGSSLGALTAFAAVDAAAVTTYMFIRNKSGLFSATAMTGTAVVTAYVDMSSTFVDQPGLVGAGISVITATSTWALGTSYPIGSQVFRNGVWYQALSTNTGNDPAVSPTFWKPVSRQRYSNAGADLWYQLTGAGPYANGGAAGVEAMTSSAGVLENQPGPFVTAPVLPTGERIRTATSTKNPAAAAATVWAWCRPGVVTAAALLWGKLVDASDVTASIRIGFTAAGLPTASIRRTGQPADDTATAGAEHTLGAGQLVLVAATYDGANLRLYVNGELAATTAAAGTLDNTALSSWIAGATLGGLTPYVGKLDEVGMDNTVYTQATLAKMAAAGQAWLS